MKQKNDKRIYLDDYISVAKNDAIIRVVFTIIIIIFMLFTKIYIDEYFKLFVIFIFILLDLWFIRTYIVLLQIKKYLIETKKYDNTLKIDFWNENNVIFIDRNIIIFTRLKIISIKYKDIMRAKVLIKRRKGRLLKYLLLTLIDESTNKILIYDGIHYDIDENKILDYLKEKNPDIIIEEAGSYWKYKYNKNNKC